MNAHTSEPAEPQTRQVGGADLLTATSVALHGTTGHLVGVQTEPAAGRHRGLLVLGRDGYNMVETRDRDYAGIINAGLTLPARPMTVSLPPGDDLPAGSGADLAVAAVLLAAAGHIPRIALAATVLIGEVGLDGTIGPVRGVQPMVRAAATHKFATVVVPVANAGEAQPGTVIDVVAVDSLHQFVAWAVTGRRPALPSRPPPAGQTPTTTRQPT